jgi:tRNA-uridine 2-sulfurtransferase
VDRIEGSAPRWCSSVPQLPLRCTVQLRAHGAEHRAVVRLSAGQLLIDLLDPARGIAPGQTAVVYDGSRVVGSCTVVSASRGPAAGMTDPATVAVAQIAPR